MITKRDELVMELTKLHHSFRLVGTYNSGCFGVSLTEKGKKLKKRIDEICDQLGVEEEECTTSR